MGKIKSKKKPIIIIVASVLALVSGVLIFLNLINYFNIVEIIVSSNNTTTTTVYKDTSNEYDYYFNVKGDLNYTDYIYGGYNGVYVSPCCEYIVVSTIYEDDKSFLTMTDFKNNSDKNLTSYLRTSIVNSGRVKELSNLNSEQEENIQVDMIKWTNVKDVMTVEFEYIDSEDRKTAGTLDYNCVTQMISNVDYETEV